jgi:hypothetical protein
MIRGIGRALLLLLLLAILWSRSQVPLAQDRPTKATIILTMSATDRNGMTRAMATTGDDFALKVGESRKAFFYLGPTGSASGLDFDHPWQWLDQYRYSWQVQVQLASIGLDTVTLDIDWQRLESDGSKARQAAGDHRTITLNQDGRHVLDFLPFSPTDSRVANAVFEVRAAPVEESVFAELRFGYDLWLVQLTAGGAKMTRHVTVNGRQGEKVPFRFEPVPLPLDMRAQPEAESPLKLHVAGTISGRQTPDGSLQIDLQPRRSFQIGGGGGGTSGGIKTFVVQPGETVNLELPSANGYFTLRPDGGLPVTNPMVGVSNIAAGLAQIELKPYLDVAQTSIILTVRKQAIAPSNR